MNALVHFYRRLNEWQQTLVYRIAASIVIVAACAFIFGSWAVTSRSIEHQRQQLVEALSGQNIQRGTEHAVSLRATGTVTVKGRTYGDEAFRNPPVPIFDEEGNLIQVDWLVANLLADQRPTWLPNWMIAQPGTTLMLGLITTAWLLLVVWIGLSLPFAILVIGAAIPATILWELGWTQSALALAGIGYLSFTFVLLTKAALLALYPRNQMLAVAHTVIKEASRRGISLAFIGLLLVVLPLMPMMLNPASPLRYRVQTFLSASLGVTFAIAAVMSLFFACATVAFEIRDRQIWHLMTKPLTRLNYLMGKWLGVMILNFILLIVAGVSIFTFVQYLREQPVAAGEVGVLDRMAVNDEVLTARVAVRPHYEQLSTEDMRRIVDHRIANDPVLAEMENVPVAARRNIEKEIRDIASMRQRSIPPWDPNTAYSQANRTYLFTGLQEAKRKNSTLTLTYRFHILADSEHAVFRALFVLNRDPNLQQVSQYVPTMRHQLSLSPHLIRDDGTLEITIVNLHQPPENMRGIGALNFDEQDFELLFSADSFEANFFRALLTIWIKLAVLAALGIGCATFLSFPVACLLSFTIFFAGVLGPFLTEALGWYLPQEVDKVDWRNVGMVLTWLMETVTRAISQVVVFLLGGFGEYRPTQALVEGKLIPWSEVASGFARLGLVWSSLSMIVGYFVLRNRQLAIYSGQG